MTVGDADPHEGGDNPQSGFLSIESIFQQVSYRCCEDQKINHLPGEGRGMLPERQLEGQETHRQNRRHPGQGNGQQRNIRELTDALLVAPIMGK